MAAGKQINEYWHVLARILSDDGIEGFVYVVTFSAALVKPLADATRELADLLKGMHVFEPEASWAKLTRAANWVGRAVSSIARSHRSTLRCGMPLRRQSISRCIGSLAGLATGYRHMPATIFGTACQWLPDDLFKIVRQGGPRLEPEAKYPISLGGCFWTLF
jgi:hypothetical protein